MGPNPGVGLLPRKRWRVAVRAVAHAALLVRARWQRTEKRAGALITAMSHSRRRGREVGFRRLRESNLRRRRLTKRVLAPSFSSAFLPSRGGANSGGLGRCVLREESYPKSLPRRSDDNRVLEPWQGGEPSLPSPSRSGRGSFACVAWPMSLGSRESAMTTRSRAPMFWSGSASRTHVMVLQALQGAVSHGVMVTRKSGLRVRRRWHGSPSRVSRKTQIRACFSAPRGATRQRVLRQRSAGNTEPHEVHAS